MPFVRVIVDGSLVASIDTNGKDMVSVWLSGALVRQGAAHLSVDAGTYSSNEKSQHLTWVDETLEAGQTVQVEFLENSVEFGKGRTIEEIDPDYRPGAEPIASRAEAISRLEAMPRLRDRFALRLSDEDGEIGALSSEGDEIGFGLSVNWTSGMGDADARVSLTAYSVESIRKSEDFRRVMTGKLRIGSALSCELVA